MCPVQSFLRNLVLPIALKKICPLPFNKASCTYKGKQKQQKAKGKVTTKEQIMTNERVAQNMFVTFNMLMCEHKVSRSYGTQTKISFSEIGLLQCVQSNKNSKAGELSVLLGMTNGAVTQLAKKCIDKGLIVSYQASTNRKEVFYKLTPQGEKACNGYDEHYELLKSAVANYLKTLSAEQLAKTNGLFDVVIKSLHVNKNCSLLTQEECNERGCEKCKKVY